MDAALDVVLLIAVVAGAGAVLGTVMEGARRIASRIARAREGTVLNVFSDLRCTDARRGRTMSHSRTLTNEETNDRGPRGAAADRGTTDEGDER